MKLIVIRHGESEDNFSGTIGGKLDSSLTQKGIEQIHNLAKILQDKYSFDAVYTSPRTRTLETTKILIADLNIDLPLNIEQLITERDFGLLSGKQLSEIDFHLIDNAKPNNEYGIETLDELKTRITTFLANIKLLNYQNVLVVSHSNPIRSLISIQKNISFTEALENYPVKNGEYFEFEI